MSRRDNPALAAAKKFVPLVSTLEFDADQFGRYITEQSVTVQRRVLSVFLAIVDAICMKYDFLGFPVNPEEIELFVEAKRMQECMDVFR